MLTQKQCERIATTADLWNATVSLCSAGFRITVRNNGYENVRVISYTEIGHINFPCDTLCDTIRNMATDKAPAPTPPSAGTQPAATLIVDGRRLAIGDQCLVVDDDWVARHALILDIADHTIKVSFYNGVLEANVDFLRLRHVP